MQCTELGKRELTPRNRNVRLSTAPRQRLRSARRLVSEIIGTILILALTVVLFSAIFYFVSTLPTPASSSTSQFQSVLGISGGGTETNINITYNAGPTLNAADTAIYLASNAHTGNFACTRTGSRGDPYTVQQSTGSFTGSTTWSAGQTWDLALAIGTTVCTGSSPTVSLSSTSDNVTISIVNTATNTLLFHVILPGTTPKVPPIFTNYGVYQANPGLSSPYTIYTNIKSTDLNYATVAVTSTVPGFPSGSLLQLCQSTYTCSDGSGTWSFTETSLAGVQANTQYSFVISAAGNISGQTNSIVFTYTFITPGGGACAFQAALAANPGNPSVAQAVALTTTFTNIGGASCTAITIAYRVAGYPASTFYPYTIQEPTGYTLNVSITNSTVRTWTPSGIGQYTVYTWANASGGVSQVASLQLTVFPRTLVIDETGVTPGTNASTDTYTYLTTDLSSADIPYTSVTETPGASNVAWDCSAPSCLNNYDVIIWLLSNAATLSSSDQTAIECAIATSCSGMGGGQRSVWLVGAGVGSGLTSTLQADLGLTAVSASPVSLASVANGVQQLAVSASSVIPSTGIYQSNLYLDGNLPSLSQGGYMSQPHYYTLTAAASGTSVGTNFLTAGVGGSAVAVSGTGDLASCTASGSGGGPCGFRSLTMPFELASVAWTEPWGGSTYVTSLANQASIVYDAYNYLANFTKLTPVRDSNDWAVSSVDVQPNVLTFNNQAYVNFTVRNNGPTLDPVTAELLLDGLPYYYNGAPIETTVTPAASGGVAKGQFNWTPSVIGYLTVGVEIIPPSGDSNSANNQMENSLFAVQLYVHYSVLLVDATKNPVAGGHDTTTYLYNQLIADGYPSNTISTDTLTSGCASLPAQAITNLEAASPRYNLVVWNLGDTINGTNSCPLSYVNMNGLESFLNNGGSSSSLLFIGNGLMSDGSDYQVVQFARTFLGVYIPTTVTTVAPSGPLYGSVGDEVGNGVSIPYVGGSGNTTGNDTVGSNLTVVNNLYDHWSFYFNDLDYWTVPGQESPNGLGVVSGTARGAGVTALSTASGWHTAYWGFNLASVGSRPGGTSALDLALLRYSSFAGRLLPYSDAVVDAPDITFSTTTQPWANFDQMNPQLEQQYLIRVNVTNLGGTSAVGVGVEILDGTDILGSSSVTVAPSSAATSGSLNYLGSGTVSVSWTPLYGAQNPIEVIITTPSTAKVLPGVAQSAEWNVTVYLFYDNTNSNTNQWTHQELTDWAQSGSGSPPVGQQIYYSDDSDIPTGPLTADPGAGTAGSGGAYTCPLYSAHACRPAFNGTTGDGTFTGFNAGTSTTCTNSEPAGVQGCWYVIPATGTITECEIALAVYYGGTYGTACTWDNGGYGGGHCGNDVCDYASCIDTYDGIGAGEPFTSGLLNGYYIYLPTTAQGAPGPGSACPAPGGTGTGGTQWAQETGVCYEYLWECTSNYYDDNQNYAGTVDWIYSLPIDLASVGGVSPSTASANWWQAYAISPYQNGGIVCVTTSVGSCPTSHGGSIISEENTPGSTEVVTPGPGYSGTVAWEDSAGKCEVIQAFTGSNTGFSNGVPDTWQYETVNLSYWIGDSAVYVAFGYVQGTAAAPCQGSDSPVEEGWLIDQFQVEVGGGTTQACSQDWDGGSYLTCYGTSGSTTGECGGTAGDDIPYSDLWRLQTSTQLTTYTGDNTTGAQPPTGSAWTNGATNTVGGVTYLELQPNEWDQLYSRSIDLSNAANATLTFNYLWSRYAANMDPPQGLTLDVSPVLANGATDWVQVWSANLQSNGAMAHGNNQVWQFAKVNLQGYIGSVVKLEFIVGTNCGGDADDAVDFNYPQTSFSEYAEISGVYIQGATTISAQPLGAAVIAAMESAHGQSTATSVVNTLANEGRSSTSMPASLPQVLAIQPPENALASWVSVPKGSRDPSGPAGEA